MDILLESLGAAGAKQFLRASLPHIQQYHANLLAAMSAQDWAAAASCAHLLKGTAALYATKEFISLLEKIIKKDDAFWQAKALVESDWFQCEVNFECSIERAIEFSDFLKTLLQNGGGEVNFINEDGNVDLNINLKVK